MMMMMREYGTHKSETPYSSGDPGKRECRPEQVSVVARRCDVALTVRYVGENYVTDADTDTQNGENNQQHTDAPPSVPFSDIADTNQLRHRLHVLKTTTF